MKYYVVSDIHDHYSLLNKTLMDNGFFNSIDNKLIICGDAFYNGPEPGEMFKFLDILNSNDQLIFIYGNHDLELLDNLKNGEFKRNGNRSCISKLIKFYLGVENLSDKELIDRAEEIGFVKFLENVPKYYYETKHYIFTHGFIPTNKHKYKVNWRESSVNEFRGTTTKDGMAYSLRDKISESGKTIVFGHFSAARCYLMKNATEADWKNKIYKDVSKVPPEGFKTFYGDTFIDLDQNIINHNFVNCLIIED